MEFGAIPFRDYALEQRRPDENLWRDCAWHRPARAQLRRRCRHRARDGVDWRSQVGEGSRRVARSIFNDLDSPRQSARTRGAIFSRSSDMPGPRRHRRSRNEQIRIRQADRRAGLGRDDFYRRAFRTPGSIRDARTERCKFGRPWQFIAMIPRSASIRLPSTLKSGGRSRCGVSRKKRRKAIPHAGPSFLPRSNAAGWRPLSLRSKDRLNPFLAA